MINGLIHCQVVVCCVALVACHCNDGIFILSSNASSKQKMRSQFSVSFWNLQ